MSILSKINYILSSKDKKRLVIITILTFISAFFDLIGVSAVLPVVSLLTSTSSDSGGVYQSIIYFISNIFSLTSKSSIVISLIIVLSVFYLFKAAYTIFLTYVTNKFNMSFKRRMSSRMIKAYLSMPYEYHLQHNSSTLLRSATYDAELFASAMNSVIQLILKFSTVLILFGYLLYNDILTGQFTTLIVGGVILITSIFILTVLKKHIRGVAKVIQRLNGDNYKLLSQAFNGIKESKISNREAFFADCYERNVININHYQIRSTLYNSIPSIFLETFGLIALLFALIVSVLTKEESSYPSIVASFSVLALATIKLLPAASNINAHINSLNYTKASVDLLYNDIKNAEDNEEYITMHNTSFKPMIFKNRLDVENVSFVYSGTEKVVLDNISFSIKKGESVAISGDSGAGKTTTVDLILGLLKPTSGDILCDGVSISSNQRGWHTNLSYIPQNIYLMDDTIRNNVAFGYLKNEIDDRKVWEALEKAQLTEFVNSLPKGLDTVIGERGIRMSGGQRQRIGIARAFYRDTQIIVFDEATSALDYETEKRVLEQVNQYKGEKTLIIITHRLNTIESCDHIYKIEKGTIKQIK